MTCLIPTLRRDPRSGRGWMSRLTFRTTGVGLPSIGMSTVSPRTSSSVLKWHDPSGRDLPGASPPPGCIAGLGNGFWWRPSYLAPCGLSDFRVGTGIRTPSTGCRTRHGMPERGIEDTNPEARAG